MDKVHEQIRHWIDKRDLLVSQRICSTCGAKVSYNLDGLTELLYKGYGDCPECLSHYIFNKVDGESNEQTYVEALVEARKNCKLGFAEYERRCDKCEEDCPVAGIG